MMGTSIRAKGTTLTSISCWLANFMIGQVTPKALESVGWKYYILFAVGGFSNAVTFWLILPETKGRTLEEVDAFIESTPWIVAFHDTSIGSNKESEEQLRRGITTVAAQPDIFETGSHDEKLDGLKTSSHDHDLEK
ncbi:conserved hypothetical protein [Sporisorium reilianum SRZ2]|uniref:Major facilitator superfamily (MFS) profile domain-containing protein n=1 Tax=Sporisorium reilianum (strain SRZ2) TaxID=999809 RepID=E6ZRI8_SPORE|nr:conserved hypothetical protein [Sporisorium reilianum SRZ2]